MKDRTISLRCTENWYKAATLGADRLSLKTGLPCSTNLFIELALVEWLKAQGEDELAALAKRENGND